MSSQLAPAALFSVTLDHAHELALPPTSKLDVMGVTLKGAARIGAARATPWTAFRASPTAGLVVKVDEHWEGFDSVIPHATVVIALVTSGEAVGPVLGELANLPSASDASASSVEVRTVDAVEDLAWGDGQFHARLVFDDPNGRASLGILMASPEGSVPDHVHETSWEMLGILQVAGKMRQASEPGTEVVPKEQALQAGALVAIPPNHQHGFSASGSGPLAAIQLYVPPGPEQRFRKLAK